MRPSILVAGIGNLFFRDDAFGVEVVSRLAQVALPGNVAVRDFGIRGFDLMLALLDGHALTILVDALPRGGTPGTLYTVVPEVTGLAAPIIENAHRLDPVQVLASARAMGAGLSSVIVVGCEPAVLEDGSGTIGLTPAVEAAVAPAIETIRSLISDFNTSCTDVAVQDKAECS